MSSNNQHFRLFAYFGSGVIFLGLLGFIFLAFPETNPMKSPLGETKAPTKKISTKLSNIPDHSSKELAAGSNANSTDSNANDPRLKNEVIIRANSKEELAKIFTRALESGGSFEGLIKELLAARITFPTKDAADAFRNSLGKDNLSDSNYIVLAPDFPTDEDLNGGTNSSPGNRTSTNTSTDGLQPFGNSALEFLGVSGDNSTWGTDLTIAILDSGVYAHESLTGINIQQIDLIQTEENPQADYTGHGTAVADIAHMLAPAADILSIRVLDSDGVGDTFTVAQGVITATDNGANVINLSLGSYGDSSVLRDAINYAVDRGVSVVAASGNDGIEQVSFPAAYENVIGVSAIDASGAFANFSNTGDGVDIGAPGVGVYTAWDEAGSASFSGTSAAAPFVSAAIAATATLNPGYTLGQASAQVLQSAQDTGAVGDDPQTGNGILQIGN